MVILAHRGNRTGVARAEENTVGALCECLAQGWGIETDIRCTSEGRFYIAHDAGEATANNAAELFFDLFARYPFAPIALNVKELGYERELICFLKEQRAGSGVFLFDMELLGGAPGQAVKDFRALDPRIRLAARVSDRAESVEQALQAEAAQVIWLDEFDSLWATEHDIRRLREAGRVVFAVSPELHGFSLDQMERRWQQFAQWNVDGICTDFPALLQASVGTMLR